MTASTPPIQSTEAAAMDQFERQTGRYGRVTMTAGLLLSLAGPFYLFFFVDLGLSWGIVITAFVTVAATFGVFWVIEPLSNYPILGPSAMYQAFMIGNISNKLLPAALVAQSAINAKPGTRRGNVAAIMAICGAATVHLLSLLICVGLLGSWLVSLISPEVIEVARLYILPSLLGAVLVQAVVSLKQWRPTVVAFAVALVLQFVVVPLVPGLTLYVTAIAVAASILISLAVRDRTVQVSADAEDT